MTNPLKYLFGYVPPEFPDVDEYEPDDPNLSLELSASYRKARNVLVTVCAIILAWATASFSLKTEMVNVFGLTVNLSSNVFPFILFIILSYQIYRWVIEYAFQERKVKRWELAQRDFKIHLNIVRMTILAFGATMLNQSIYTVLSIYLALAVVMIISAILSIPLMFIIMPIRMWARRRVLGRVSVANAASEAIIWSEFFAMAISVVGIGVLIYSINSVNSFKEIIWNQLPSIFSQIAFGVSLAIVFFSIKAQNGPLRKLFDHPSEYYTTRDENGFKIIHMERPKLKSKLP